MAHHRLTRRSALQFGAAAVLAPCIVPSRVFGANERLNIGVIGVGGRGRADLNAVAQENIVALCDVDEERLAAAARDFPNAATYHDYRELLDQQNLDAVVVATPDHHHAPATIRALQRDLHVYCEKPLTHTVAEARKIADVAASRNLVTQMGTQNHEHPSYVRLVEMLRNKVIGDIREVHVVTDRPGRWWPQGLHLPGGQQPIPSHLHWDLWLGPAAMRDYHDAYVPFRWRGWWDFGCGAIGDMAIHLMDPTFAGLELGGRQVRVHSRGPKPLPHSGPTHMTTRFTFPEDHGRKELSVYWYEGTAETPPEVRGKLPMNGSLFVGTNGEISIAHGQQPTILGEGPPGAEPEDAPPFSATRHHQQWLKACRTGGATGSNFAYAGPFTEVVLLGNVAYRVGREITYDPRTMKTGDPDADRLLQKGYRSGWEV